MSEYINDKGLGRVLSVDQAMANIRRTAAMADAAAQAQNSIAQAAAKEASKAVTQAINTATGQKPKIAPIVIRPPKTPAPKTPLPGGGAQAQTSMNWTPVVGVAAIAALALLATRKKEK